MPQGVPPYADTRSAERESSCHDDKAQGFVEYDRFQSPKPKQPDQKRQAELCATKPNQSAERTDASPGAECCQGIVLLGTRCEHHASLSRPSRLDIGQAGKTQRDCDAPFQRYDKFAITLST